MSVAGSSEVEGPEGRVLFGVSGGSLRLAILGAGRMGQEVEAAAREHSIEVVGCLGRDALVDGERVKTVLQEASVAIEFTAPDAAVNNIDLCLDAECPVVVGTTGWYEHLEEVSARVARRDGTMLWAPNFSLGVALLKILCTQAGGLLGGMDSFSAHVEETHHSTKKDAPSGTALILRDALASAARKEVEITSIRTGQVPGRHEVWIDGPHERVSLTHDARSRRVFADGALSAASWLIGRKGVYTMDDFITLEGF